jgi:O-antigen/teichoic acid export membrane protein
MTFAAASFATSVVISLASSVASSRIYGVTVIGEYALVTAPWIIVTQISSVNEQVPFLRAVALLPRRDRRISALFAAVVAFSSSLTIVVSLLAMAVATVLLRGPVGRADLVLPAAVVLGGYVLLENTSWNLDMVFAAFRRGRDLFFARAAQVVAFLVVGVAAAAFTRSVWGLVVATMASFAAAFVVRVALVGAVMQRRTTRAEIRAEVPELRRMVAFGLRLLPATLANGFTSQVGTWVLGSVTSVRQVGAYSRAGGLASRLSEAGYRVCEILFPTLVRARNDGDVEEYRRVLADSLRLTAVPLFGMVAVGAGVAGDVMSVFGPGFAAAGNALTLLMFGYAVSVIASIQSQSFLADERPLAVTLTSLVCTAITVVTVYPFARAWGGTGVAGSFLLGAVAGVLIRDVSLRRSDLLRAAPLPTASIAARVAVVAIGGFVTANAFPAAHGALGPTAMAIGAGTLVGAALAVLTGAIRPDERRRAIAMLGGRVRARP